MTASGGDATKMHYEDIEVGATVAFGRKLVTREEIVAFASAFDPQPFHLDEAAARHSLIGRLCASGWHTCAMLMRMLADDVLANAAGLGAPGVDETRFLKPVFPGDTLTARYTCTAKRLLKSRPNVGMCHMLFELMNQSGEVVLTWTTPQLYRVRRPEAAR